MLAQTPSSALTFFCQEKLSLQCIFCTACTGLSRVSPTHRVARVIPGQSIGPEAETVSGMKTASA